MRPTPFAIVAGIAVLVAVATPASAYVGPALGISALGAAAAMWTGLMAVLSYSVIMPLRSLLRTMRRRGACEPEIVPPDSES